MKFALIAGQGALPAIVAEHVAAIGDPPLICQLVGENPDVSDRFERLDFRLETLGTLLQNLQTRGITELCMLGAITRPTIDPKEIDTATLPLVPRLQQALSQGDDGALRVVIEVIEESGIAVIGAHELMPVLLPPVTKVQEKHIKDANTGEAQVAQMGNADLGQACVVLNGELVISETDAGTDVMLTGLSAPNGVLFKAPKPNQDRRVDLPAIGPNTAKLAAAAGLVGIIIEAGGVMVQGLPSP